MTTVFLQKFRKSPKIYTTPNDLIPIGNKQMHLALLLHKQTHKFHSSFRNILFYGVARVVLFNISNFFIIHNFYGTSLYDQNQRAIQGSSQKN